MSDFIDYLNDLIKIQCDNGNWNYDEYMHGLANGLILARAVFLDEEPKFLSAPDEWLRDNDTIVLSTEIMIDKLEGNNG